MQWNLALHDRLSSPANSKLLLLEQALQIVRLDSKNTDRMRLGEAVAPYSSKGFYSWFMAKRSPDDFA